MTEDSNSASKISTINLIERALVLANDNNETKHAINWCKNMCVFLQNTYFLKDLLIHSDANLNASLHDILALIKDSFKRGIVDHAETPDITCIYSQMIEKLESIPDKPVFQVISLHDPKPMLLVSMMYYHEGKIQRIIAPKEFMTSTEITPVPCMINFKNKKPVIETVYFSKESLVDIPNV